MTTQIQKQDNTSMRALFWGTGFSLVVLLSAILRFYNLDFESLWMDELIQVYTYSSASMQEVVTKAATQQQPPLDYLIGFGLERIGLAQSDWWVRVPSALFGVGSVVLMIWWCRKAIGNYAALAAGIILSLSPLHFTMSQEARPYTIFIFFTLLCLALFANAYARPKRLNLVLFAVSLFLLLLTRWVGPIVITFNLFLFVIAHTCYRKLVKRQDQGASLAHPLKMLAALIVPSLLYLPFFYNIYKHSTAYYADNNIGALSALFDKYTGMLHFSLTECFVSAWIAPFILAGLVVVVYAFCCRWPLSDPNWEQKKQRLYLAIFIIVLSGFLISYPLLFVYKTKIPPKPQYLLLMAPWGAFCLGALIDMIRKFAAGFSEAAGLIVYMLLIMAFSLPLYNGTAFLSKSKHKRDWRGLGEVVNRYQENQPPLFISVTNAYTSWSPPIYSIPRYIKSGKNHLTIRTLASGRYDKALMFGTIYAVIFKDFHGIFPPPRSMPLKNMQIHEFNELILYRYPGPVENRTERLIRLLNYLSSGAEKGDGLVEVYLAKAQAMIGIGEVQAAKTAFNDAYKQCKNQTDRNFFLRRMQTGEYTWE